jgi:hypothetical protein
MAVVTIDAKGELEAVRADIDRQTAVEDLERGAANKTQGPAETKPAASDSKDAKTEEKPTEGETTDADDIEGEDGLTPRQKREFTGAMLKAIGKKHRMMKEAEEFAAAQYSERRLAEQRAAVIERELAELKAKAQPTQETTSEATKPERAKFATDQEFLDAMIAWGVEEQLKKRAQEEAKQAEQQHIEEMLSIARQKSALVPDFADALQQAATLDIRIPPIIYDYMLQTEMGAELSYHLAKNPEVVKSLWKLQPAQQLVTIGKIEGTLKPFEAAAAKGGSKDTDGATPSSKSASTNGQQSRTAPSEETGTSPSRARDAAPVIRPLNGSGASPAEVDPRDMNTREMINDWQKKHRADFSLRKRH